MSSDLREKERTSSAITERIEIRRAGRVSRWPYVATAIVILVVLAVGALVLTQDAPGGTFPSLNTAVREGSGYAQVEQSGTFPDLNTAVREGSGYAQVEQSGTFPDLNTAVREGSGYATG